MKITERNAQIKMSTKRPPKKRLSKQDIRDMVQSRKVEKGEGKVEGEKPLRNPRTPQNIGRLKEALSDGTISFSPQERAILEKLVNP